MLGAGLRAWHRARRADGRRGCSSGRRDPFRLGPDLPRAPVAGALGRTLVGARGSPGVPPRPDRGARRPAGSRRRRRRRAAALPGRTLPALRRGGRGPLRRRRHAAARGRRAAARDAPGCARPRCWSSTTWSWSRRSGSFLAALARALPVRRLDRERPPRSAPASLRGLGGRTPASPRCAPADTPLAAGSGRAGAPPDGLRRLRETALRAARGRAGARRLGGAAHRARRGRRGAHRRAPAAARGRARRGLRGHGRGAAAARAPTRRCSPTCSTRLGVPYRLHPSLPLRRGRAARSLLLLLRCRGLARPAVMEFLTFAPCRSRTCSARTPAAARAVGRSQPRGRHRRPACARWMLGLRAYAETERRGSAGRGHRRGARAYERAGRDAETLLRLVELLSTDARRARGRARRGRSGRERLRGGARPVDRARAGPRDAGGGGRRPGRPRRPRDAARAGDDVEAVLDARLDWERLPLRRRGRAAPSTWARSTRSRACPSACWRSRAWSRAAIPACCARTPSCSTTSARRWPDGRAPPPAGPARPALPRPALAVRRRRGDGAGPAAARGPGARVAAHRAGPRCSRRGACSTARSAQADGAADPVATRAPTRAAGASACRRSSSPPPRPRWPAGRSSAPRAGRAGGRGRPRGRSTLDDALDASERDRGARPARRRGGGARDRRRLALLQGLAPARARALVAASSRRTTAWSWPLPPELARLLDPAARAPARLGQRLARYASCGFLYLLRVRAPPRAGARARGAPRARPARARAALPRGGGARSCASGATRASCR